MGLAENLRRQLEPLASRVRLIVARAVLRALEEGRKVRTLQLAVLKGETMGSVEHFQHFGFSSRPPLGTEVVIVCAGGSRDHAIAIADEHRPSRPAGLLASGEVVVYAEGGARVHVKADGSVVITAAGGVEVSADLDAAGNVSAGGDVADGIGTLSALRAAYNIHVHADPQGGTTGPPVPTV